jgi:hypothetical protein
MGLTQCTCVSRYEHDCILAQIRPTLAELAVVALATT